MTHGKDYVLQIKVKNGPMLRAIRARGFDTVSALSRACGIAQPTLTNFLNLKDPPIGLRGEIKPAVYRLAEFLRCNPMDLFPEQHYRQALKNNKAEVEVSLDEISNVEGVIDPLKIEDQKDTGRVLRAMLELLPPREADVIRRRYGIDGPEQTLEEIGEARGVGRERIRQIEAKALRHLKVRAYRNQGALPRNSLEAFN